MNIPAGLVKAVTAREVVLFAGAGMSYPSVRLSAATLRDELAADILDDYPNYDYESRSLEDVCDEFAVLNDKHSLVNRLAELIPQNAKPTDAHVAAVNLFRFIATTNWDLLFETAYRQIGQGYQVLASEADAPNFNWDQHNLLKIHGTVDRPLTLIATTDDYEEYADTHKQLLDRLSDLLYNNTVLFVGYGIRDEHVRRLLAGIRRQRGEWQKRAYAIGFYDEVRRAVLEARRISVIEAAADAVLPELAKRV